MSMPIYEYRCEACERRFEVLTSFAERERSHTCPSCESTRTRVQVSSFAAIGAGEFTSTLPMAPTPRAGGGCCGGACGCSHN
jgi:putative FmdB family regulatory protein